MFNSQPKQAVRTLSIFLVAMMLSRFFFGLQDQFTGIQLTPVGSFVLVGAGLMAIVALCALMRTRNLKAARVWLFLIGFVLAPFSL